MPAFNRITDNIFQGSWPESIDRAKELGIELDIIINVDDSVNSSLENKQVSFYKSPIHYWFPINEWSTIPYETFYAVKKIIDANPDKKILVHCAAGIMRSNLAVYAYLFSHGQEELLSCFKGNWRLFIEAEGTTKAPPCLEEFLLRMNDLPTYSVIGVLGWIMNKDKAVDRHPIIQYLQGDKK